MEFFKDVWSGENEFFEWFYFLALALILAFGTIATLGTLMDTERPVVSVFSCSMYPDYQRGDILLVRGVDFSEIEVEDVVVYKVPDRVDFSISGENYTLEENSPDFNTSVDTSIGRVELVDVIPDLEPGEDGNTNDRVILRIDGDRTVLEEGDSERVKVDRASAMPIPVVHRVVDKNEGYLQTRGDANSGQLDFESDVRPFQVHGRTSFKIPLIGAVKILAMDLVGFQGDKPLVLDVYSPCR